MQKHTSTKKKDIPIFETDISCGLTEQEVGERIEVGLDNRFLVSRSKSYFRICMENIFNFCNSITMILIIMMIATNNISDTISSCIIFLNMAIGIAQEVKAKKTVEKLSLIVENVCTVIRSGERLSISTKELVRDDIFIISAGMQIPADAVLLDGFIETDESILTGESAPQKREIGDTLLAGSYALVGEVTARAIAVGKDCYIQNVAKEMRRVSRPKSKIFGALNKFIKGISIALIPLGILNFVIAYVVDDAGLRSSIQSMAGSVLAMLPVGMFLLTSAALAAGIIRLSKKKTLVQDLYSIEMLAMVDTLLLDKTGTITTGELHVGGELAIGESELSPEKIISALLIATKDKNVTALALKDRYNEELELPFTDILPFSSGRKYSAVMFKDYGAYVIGAPDYVVNADATLTDFIDRNSQVGRRVLVLAKSDTDDLTKIDKDNCTAIFVVALDDTIRDDAKITLDWFRDNDVDIRIISGDEPRTVSEIAKATGVDGAEKYVNCANISKDELKKAIADTKVFGRVSPEQKCDIVKELQSQGHVVGMVGDGVNDLQALKESDCSISFASANEVARNVSRIVMLDSSFNSIPDVVLEGRRAINNVQSVASLYIMKNIFAIFITFLFICLRKPYPFNASQMLLIEFFVLGIPSFCLALQPNKKRVSGNFIPNVMKDCVPAGIALIAGILLLFLLNTTVWHFADTTINTMAIFALTLSGFAILAVLCMPFTKFRLIVFFGSLVLCLAAVPLVWVINNTGFISPETFSFDVEQISALQYAYLMIGVAVSTVCFIGLRVLFRVLYAKVVKWKSDKRNGNREMIAD